MPARYLVRFDDVCPGMNWSIWDRVERALDASGVAPMLAVVPDNQDPHLDVHPPEPRFWDRVRAWQARGWTIGLHGYQHRYVTQASGLIGLNARSEFAGLPREAQEDKLRKGLAIFREQSVRADVWIAPGHSFDRTTVSVLQALGVQAISDGFFTSACRDAAGVLWVPQQLWGFRARAFGTWTVCFHANEWNEGDFARFDRDLAAYRDRIVSLHDVAASPVRAMGWHDVVTARARLAAHRGRAWLRSRIRRER